MRKVSFYSIASLTALAGLAQAVESPTRPAETGTSALGKMHAYTDRSYYTTESAARVICALGLPDDELREYVLTADCDGSVVGRAGALATRAVVPVALAKLGLGAHSIQISLRRRGDRVLAQQTAEIVKLAPKPGFEVKVDRERRILLRDGQPHFPLGFFWGAPPEPLQELRLNAVSVNGLGDPKEVSPLLATAAEHGIHVILRTDVWHPKIDRLKERLGRHLAPGDIPKVWGAPRSLLMRKYWLRGKVFASLSRDERDVIYDECYQAVRPQIAESIRSARGHANVLAYLNIDEPGRADLRHFDIFKVCRKIYDLAHEIDPYRPVMVLYPSVIPGNREALEVGDVILTDPYWVPGWERPGGINHVSKIVALQRQRIDPAHKVCVVTPLASWWSMTHKRALKGEEILCEAYLALIHGAKGLIFWRFPVVAHQQQFDAFARLGREIPVIAPALLTSDVDQEVTYEPGEFDPANDVFPDVQACMFRDPKGECLLLVANSRDYPVHTRLRVPGLNGRARSLFTDAVLTVKGESFAERLEPLATRVYRLDGVEPSDRPLAIRVCMAADTTGHEPERQASSRGLPGKRNLILNPSLEEATLPLWPDYYRVGAQNPPIGHPNCPWTLVEDEPFHGRCCLRVRGKRSFRFYVAPLENAPTAYVFSIYMRTDRPRAQVSFDICRARRVMRLTGTGWQRYSFPVTVPANLGERARSNIVPLTDDATIWMDALQLEKGSELTEFQP